MNTDNRSFDVFLKSISKIQNITEAKRLRNDVEREVRQVQARLSVEPIREGGRNKEKESVVKTKQLEAYLLRLESAKRKVDRKIGKLSGTSPTADHSGRGDEDQVDALGTPLAPSLRDILTNPSPLSFYMEFMDRRKQARLVQFWLTVESFKNPLEEADSSDDDEQLGYSRLSSSMQRMDAAGLSTMREDVAMIWAMFLDPSTVTDAVPLRSKLFDSIRAGATVDESGLGSAPVLLDQARKATFRAQRDIYSAMLEDHFPDFRKTDLYRKAVIDLNKAAKKGSRVVQLGSRPSEAVSNPPESASAMLRQGSLSPINTASPLPNTSSQSRWLNQLVGFGGNKPRGGVESHAPATPMAARPRRALASFQPRSDKAEDGPSPLTLHRELPRVRSWSTGISDRSGAISPTPAPSQSLHALGFLIGDETPDDYGGRSALFATEDDDKVITSPDTGRFPSEQDEEYVQVQRMEAIQAALTSIIDRDDQSRGIPLADEPRPRASMDSNIYPRSIGSIDIPNSDDHWDPLGVVPSDPMSPDLNLGNRPFLGETGSRASMDGRNRSLLAPQLATKPRKMFDSSEDAPMSGDLFRSTTSSSVPGLSSLERHLSSDGTPLTVLDTRLSLEIARLGELLAKLDEQDQILDQMIRTADLTGKESELQLLLRSQSDLRRELRATRFRKMQYEQQEIDYRLDPERTKLTIPHATVLAEEAGKQIVRYVVEVQQHSIEGEYLQGWSVARRYNEFWDLQHALKASPAVGPELKARNLDVPSKKLLPKLTDTFVEGRRVALERYMKVSTMTSDLFQGDWYRRSSPFHKGSSTNSVRLRPSCSQNFPVSKSLGAGGRNKSPFNYRQAVHYRSRHGSRARLAKSGPNPLQPGHVIAGRYLPQTLYD
jgi:sorting nexin-25